MMNAAIETVFGSAMDALSHILDDIHFSHAEYLYVLGENGHGIRLAPQQGVMFYVVLQGELFLTLEHDQQRLPLRTGNVLMLPFRTPHQICFGEPQCRRPLHDLQGEFRGHRNDPVMVYTNQSSHLLLGVRCQIDTEMAAPLFAGLPDYLRVSGEDELSRPEWLRIGLEFLALETQLARPGRDSLMNRLIGMFLVECIRDYVEQLSSDSESWLVALQDPQLSVVLTALHQHPERPWTVAELARMACMSRSAFAAHFHTVMHQPPLGYLVQHRLRLAARALRRQQHSIARISEQVGYSSESAFSQAFRRAYGISPGQYRRQFSDKNA